MALCIRKLAEYLKMLITHPLHHAEVSIHEEMIRRALAREELEQNYAKAVRVAFLGNFPSLHVLCSKN
jgi:hypothetical protein